jgi:hypothetical protein
MNATLGICDADCKSMKTKEILLIIGLIFCLITITGCIIVPGRHHTEVIAPLPPPPVIVAPVR